MYFLFVVFCCSVVQLILNQEIAALMAVMGAMEALCRRKKSLIPAR